MRRQKHFLSWFGLWVLSLAVLCQAAELQSPVADNWAEQAEVLQKAGLIAQVTGFEVGLDQTEPNLEQAFTAQKQQVLHYIDSKRFDQAQNACQRLLADFKDHNDITAAAYEIALEYDQAEQTEQRNRLYDYIEQHWFESEWAIHCQRDRIHAAVEGNDDQAEQTGLDTLLIKYADHKDIAGTIYNLGKYYNDRNDHGRALQLHQYNVKHYSQKQDGLYSQVEIVKLLIDVGKQTEADAAVNTLATDFAQNAGLSKELYQIARIYEMNGDPNRAQQVDRYNKETFPNDLYGACSDVCRELMMADNDTSTPEQVLAKLKEFNNHQDLPRVLYELGRDYLKQEKFDLALPVFGYNSTELAEAESQYPMWSLTEIAQYHIRNGDISAAESAVQTLLQDYTDQETLPKELGLIGDNYARVGMVNQAKALYDYILDHWSDRTKRFRGAIGQIRLAIAQGDHEAVQARINDLISKYNDRTDLPDAVYENALEYYNQGVSQTDPAVRKVYLYGAAQVWEKIITALPVSENDTTRLAYFCAAVCYSQELKQYQKGIDYFQYYVDHWPDHPDALIALGSIGRYYEKLGSKGEMVPSLADQKAAQVYQAILEKYPNNAAVPIIVLKLGKVYNRQEQWSDAAVYFETFLEKYPESPRFGYAVKSLIKAYNGLELTEKANVLYNTFKDQMDLPEYLSPVAPQAGDPNESAKDQTDVQMEGEKP